MGYRGHLLGADLHTGRYRAGMCSCCCIYNICRMCSRCDRRDCRGGSGQYRFSGTGSTGFSGRRFHGIMLLGIGLAGLGVSALLGWLVVWGIKALVSASIGAIKRSNEKRKTRKLEQEKDAADWTYKEEV